MNGFLRIIVRNFREQFTNGNFHTEFLADFADQALLVSFAGFTFATGKFPKPTKVGYQMALCDEKLAGAKNERGADLGDFLTGRHSCKSSRAIPFAPGQTDCARQT